MTDPVSVVTATVHDCNAEAPDLASTDGQAKAGQVFVCSCGRVWFTSLIMSRGTPPTAQWRCDTEPASPPTTTVPPSTEPEGDTT